MGWISLYETPFVIYTSICTDGSIMQALGKYAGFVVFKNSWLEPHINPSRGRQHVHNLAW